MDLKGAAFSLFILICILSSHAQRDSLLQGHQLKDGEYLVSAGKVFYLGFFTPITRKRTNGYLSPEIFRHNRYLGIWYNGKDVDHKPVWVANRDTPIPDTTGSLKIDDDGKLEILQNGKTVILLSSKLASKKQTRMVLMDTGNMVLSEVGVNGSGGRILWQSFDYPTDTLLQGMRLGFKHKWEITSWVSDEVPARGTFTLGADPNGTIQLIIWKRGEFYWKSGNWNSGQFENLHDSSYGFEFTSNNNESFFTLTLSAIQDKSVRFPAVMIDQLGVLRDITVESPYDRHNLVDCHQGQSGCVGFELPECRGMVGSESRGGYIVYDCLNYARDFTWSLVDCSSMCWNNCSCVAYASRYENGTGCQFCSGIKQGYMYGNGESGDLHIIRYPKDWRLLRLWTVIGTVIFLSVLFIAYICYSLCKKLKMDIFIRQLYYFLRRKVGAIGSRITEGRTSFVELGTTTSYSAIKRKRKLKVLYYKSHGLRLFTLENLSQATDGFSPFNKLGQGGFGTVYKGKLAGGQEVAVKRLSRSSKQGVMEFKNELKVIAKLQHTNLVAIIGCCVERGEKIVVYEYMPNKSLDIFLFDPNRKLYLDWKKRLNIIEGIAQGLLYLHKYSTLKIVHRDLKAANILLDEEMNAKISDFGMARIFGRDESQVKTKRIVGTPGYMSPEYLIGGKYSAKSDVFSFGVMLIEIVSGKKNYGSYHPDRPLNLVGQAWELWTENGESELIDETLAGGLCDKEQAMRYIHVGLLCAQEQPSDRPSIYDVVAMISNGSIRLNPPNRPGFLVGESSLMKIEELHQEKSFNVVSISEEVGR